MPPKSSTPKQSAPTPGKRQPTRAAARDSTLPGAYRGAFTRSTNGTDQAVPSGTTPFKGVSTDAEAVKGPKGPIATAIAGGDKVAVPETPAAGSSEAVTAPKGTGKGKGKGRAVGEEQEEEQENGPEERTKTRKRTPSARLEMFKKDPKRFIKIKKAKDRNDKKAAEAAAKALIEDAAQAQAPVDAGPATQAPKKTAGKATKANNKNTAEAEAEVPDDATTETDEESATQAINNIEAQEADNEAPQASPAKQPPKKRRSRANPKPANTDLVGGILIKKKDAKKNLTAEGRRKHRKRDFQYESAPSDSELEIIRKEDNAKETCIKLRETIDRHARWCPFVHLNKKLHHAHRRIAKLQEDLYGDSDDSDDDEEIVEVQQPKAKAKKDVGKKKDPKPQTQKQKDAAKKTSEKNATKNANEKGPEQSGIEEDLNMQVDDDDPVLGRPDHDEEFEEDIEEGDGSDEAQPVADLGEKESEVGSSDDEENDSRNNEEATGSEEVTAGESASVPGKPCGDSSPELDPAVVCSNLKKKLERDATSKAGTTTATDHDGSKKSGRSDATDLSEQAAKKAKSNEDSLALTPIHHEN